MRVDPILKQLEYFQNEGKFMFVSSSFQTYSIVLLHIISRFDPFLPVYFINTGYHFPETIVHKNKVASLLGLQVFDLVPVVSKHLQRDEQGNLLFTFDPDYCCYLNKIQPMEVLLEEFDVWINGVRGEQSKAREKLSVLDYTNSKAIRYHPLLDWSNADMDGYIRKHKLPSHPLEKKGYKSIGCEPCTRPADYDSREGRWYGLRKKECGLNTDLVNFDKDNQGD
jgi:phosphoadenosine phosphosulfate reductase